MIIIIFALWYAVVVFSLIAYCEYTKTPPTPNMDIAVIIALIFNIIVSLWYFST